MKEEGEKTNPVLRPWMWLVFGGRGSPCAGVFVVYIPRAPRQLLGWCDSNTWCLIRSLRYAAIYHASIRSTVWFSVYLSSEAKRASTVNVPTCYRFCGPSVRSWRRRWSFPFGPCWVTAMPCALIMCASQERSKENSIRLEPLSHRRAVSQVDAQE